MIFNLLKILSKNGQNILIFINGIIIYLHKKNTRKF